MAETGLSKKQLKTLVEDVLRHSDKLTHETIAEAIATAIAENNKAIRKSVTSNVAGDIISGLEKKGIRF